MIQGTIHNIHKINILMIPPYKTQVILDKIWPKEVIMKMGIIKEDVRFVRKLATMQQDITSNIWNLIIV